MKNLNPDARLNVTAIIFVSLFLGLYFKYGRAFLSWRNFSILVLAGVAVFLMISRSRSDLLKTIFILALVPIIPDPFGGVPVCTLLILLYVLIYGTLPRNPQLIRFSPLPLFLLVIVTFSVLIAGISNWTSGNMVFLFAWMYGILLIYMSIKTFPTFVTATQLVSCYWIGSSLTNALGLVLSIFSSVKLPGISVSVKYAYKIGSQTYGRYSGVLGDYELYGQFCGLSCLVSLYVGLTANNFKKKFAGYTTYLISIQQLFLTGTRSSLILTIFSTFFLLIRVYKNRINYRLGLSLLVVVMSTSVFFLKSAINQSGSITRIDKSLGNIALAFDSDRGNLWKHFLDLMPQELIKIPKYLQFPLSEFGTLPHSLPLALVIMFGIFPTIAFLILAVFPLKILSWNGSLQDYLMNLMLSQILLESLKVEAIRLPQYLTVFFTLIAICYVGAVERDGIQEFHKKTRRSF